MTELNVVNAGYALVEKATTSTLGNVAFILLALTAAYLGVKSLRGDRRYRFARAGVAFVAAAVAAVAAVAPTIIPRVAQESDKRLALEAQARREIENALGDFVDALVANDFERATQYLSLEATQTRALFEQNRAAVKIADASISKIRVDNFHFDSQTSSALVSCRARVVGTALAWPTSIRLPYNVELEISDLMMRREADGVWRALDRYVARVPNDALGADELRHVVSSRVNTRQGEDSKDNISSVETLEADLESNLPSPPKRDATTTNLDGPEDEEDDEIRFDPN